MMTLQDVKNAIDRLTPEQKQQVLEYLQQSDEGQQEPKERVFGLHKGNIWISDDFDDELPLEFWLGH